MLYTIVSGFLWFSSFLGATLIIAFLAMAAEKMFAYWRGSKS